MKSIIQFNVGAAMLAAALAWPAGAMGQDLAARDMAATCANCHGTGGRSVGVVPGLAGVEKGQMVQQLQDFKAGKRTATIMHQIAKGLSDAQIEQIAAYFAAQPK